MGDNSDDLRPTPTSDPPPSLDLTDEAESLPPSLIPAASGPSARANLPKPPKRADAQREADETESPAAPAAGSSNAKEAERDFLMGLTATPEARDALVGPPVDAPLGSGAPSSGDVKPLTTPALGVLTGPAKRPRRGRAGALVFALMLMAGSAAAFVLLKPRGEAPEAQGPAAWVEAPELPATTEADPASANDEKAPEPPEEAAPATPSTNEAPAEVRPAPEPQRASAPKAKPAPRPQAPKPAPVAVKPSPPPSTTESVLGPFDKSAAVNALTQMAGEASACRKSGDPSGMASVTVTFAPSGRVTSAVVGGPPFAGTATGGCIASTLRRARVPAFAGEHVTVTKTVVIH